MTGEVLIDTNVFVYAYDARDADRRARALESLERLTSTGRGRISTQVLGETFRVLTSRLEPRVPVAEAVEHLALMASIWPVLPITTIVALQAALGVRDHRLNYWDAQLWAPPPSAEGDAADYPGRRRSRPRTSAARARTFSAPATAVRACSSCTAIS